LGSIGEVKVNDPPPTGAMVRLIGPLAVFCGAELSATLTVRFAVPAVVGIPLTVQPVRVRPAGRVPVVMEQA